MSSKFYYFGYGSNMLAKRIHIQNPTAKRVCPGKLENYRLDFYGGSNFWLGAPATIVPTTGAHVFGAIWEIDEINMKSLDDQEGVSEGIYNVITVLVSPLNGETISCRCYHLRNQPTKDIRSLPPASIPQDRSPSLSYLKTLVKGALETGIPQQYIEELSSLKHNGKIVDVMEKRLELENIKMN